MKPLSKRDYNSYNSLIESFEVQVVNENSSDDYQGSSWYLLRDNNRFGYLSFGWGSCSGCDALEACSNVEEAIQLRDELWQSITWFDSSNEARKFFNQHDWEADSSFREENFKQFIEDCKNALDCFR